MAPREPRRGDSEEAQHPGIAFPIEHTRVTGRRAIAHIADGWIYTLIAIIPVVLAAASGSNALTAIAFVLFAIPGPIVYYVLFQRRSGRSPGKSLLNIRVVDAEGAVPSTGALVRRSIPLLVEYFYVVSLIAILSSEERQRLGDRWAGTYVIRDEEGQLE